MCPEESPIVKPCPDCFGEGSTNVDERSDLLCGPCKGTGKYSVWLEYIRRNNIYLAQHIVNPVIRFKRSFEMSPWEGQYLLVHGWNIPDEIEGGYE